MAIDNFKLPKDKIALARVLDKHVKREEQRLGYWRVMALLAHAYMNGARRFTVFNPLSGELRSEVLDKGGKLGFKSQELLSQIDRVSGRIASSDLSPKVERPPEGQSLSAIRDRAVAQVIADATVNQDQLDRIQTQFSHLFTTLGSCGVQGHMLDHPTIGLSADLEVVHPREVFPFPSPTYDYTKQRGIVRQRWVPMSMLKDKYGARIARNEKDMSVWEREIGEPLEEEVGNRDIMDPYATGFRKITREGDRPPGATDDESMKTVLIRELWLDGVRDTCTRYIVTSGDYVIDDQDFEGLEVYCPLGWARFMETGTFHGAGMFHLLYSMARELEGLLKSLFSNIRDTDRYGVVVLPQGSFNQQALLRDVGRGLRALFYEPETYEQGFTPFTIAPATTGDLPGRVAQFARQIMGELSPVQDLIQEKGRVDSAPGLQFLDEQINQAMTNPTRGIRQAFGTMWRSVTAQATAMLIDSPRPLPVSRLNLELAGAVIDPDANTVSFDFNPVPNVSKLRFLVREASPGSRVARKQEAMALQQQLQLDYNRLALIGLKEGLDFAMWDDDVEAAYESIVRDILVLFGDGVEDGQVWATPHTVTPEIQLLVLDTFMSSNTMKVADPEVVDEFIAFREFLMQSAGFALTEAVPNPDDAALFRQVEQQRQEMLSEFQQPNLLAAGQGQ